MWIHKEHPTSTTACREHGPGSGPQRSTCCSPGWVSGGTAALAPCVGSELLLMSIIAVFTSRARIIDFHQPTGPGDTHPRLFDWVRQYFLQSSQSNRLPPKVIRTSLPPLYLQHQGKWMGECVPAEAYLHKKKLFWKFVTTFGNSATETLWSHGCHGNSVVHTFYFSVFFLWTPEMFDVHQSSYTLGWGLYAHIG